jgi:uncharacterized protein (TIGR03067 family)
MSDARIQKGSLRLFRLAGIDVFVHWSWLIVAYFRIQSRAGADTPGVLNYTSPVWNVVEYLAIFGIVLLHEFGHVLACRQVGGLANKIVLWPLGGVALVQPPPRPGAFLWSIAAGPLVNLLLLPPTVGLAVVSHFAHWDHAAPDFARFLTAMAAINAGLLFFNLLPIFPLDGGQILQALLWFLIGRARSLLVVTVIGLVTGLGLFVLALLGGALWICLIAGFAMLASLGGLMQARARLRMLKVRRREGVACPSCGTAPPVGAYWACPRCFQRFDFFEHAGACPHCSAEQESGLCQECGRRHAYADWFPDAVAVDEPADEAPPSPPEPARPPRRVLPPTPVAARLGCAALLGAAALAVALANGADRRPIDLLVWGAGGALLGGTLAGPFLRNWQRGRARDKLKGTWRLVEEDGLPLDGSAEPVFLVLSGLKFETRDGKKLVARGLCWVEPQPKPASITLTARTGPDLGKPRQGVYRLQGRVLTLCLAVPGAPRPTEFVAVPGVQQLYVYHRGKGAVPPRPPEAEAPAGP